MNIVNCRGCGRLFNSLSSHRLCPNCVAALEKKFQEVKEYIREHTDAPIEVVSKECDVSVKQIKEWVREERLAFKAGSASGVTCGRCGKMILTGKFCDECKIKIHNNFSNAIDKKESANHKIEHDGDRMRYLQNL